MELEFKHARVHTYGYNSTWTQKQENVLDIHDFGQALLVDMFNSPHLRRNKNVSVLTSRRRLNKAITNQHRLPSFLSDTVWEVCS
jgi:hypothetical protein